MLTNNIALIATVVIIVLAAIAYFTMIHPTIIKEESKTVVVDVEDSVPEIHVKAHKRWNKDRKRIHRIHKDAHKNHPDGVSPHKNVLRDLHTETEV